MRFKTAICDDNANDIEILKKYLTHYNIETGIEFEITSFTNPQDLLSTYTTPGVYDFVFLDMEMPNEGKLSYGIDIAKKIRTIPDKDVRIIFISNYPEYMNLGYDVQASHYLCKDITIEKFDSVMNNVITLINNDASYIRINNGHNEWIILKTNDIYYIKSYPGKRDYIEYITIRGLFEEHRSILSVGEQLSKKGFAFSNKNHLVNLSHLQKIL